jgi:peroxiredoxin
MGTPEWHALRLPAGSPAPDFNLLGVEDEYRVRLSSFRGHRPVVLIFGSFT